MTGWVHFKLYGNLVGVMCVRGKTLKDIDDFAALLARRRGVRASDISRHDGPGTLPADEDEPVQHTTMWKRFNQNSDKRKGA